MSIYSFFAWKLTRKLKMNIFVLSISKHNFGWCARWIWIDNSWTVRVIKFMRIYMWVIRSTWCICIVHDCKHVNVCECMCEYVDDIVFVVCVLALKIWERTWIQRTSERGKERKRVQRPNHLLVSIYFDNTLLLYFFVVVAFSFWCNFSRRAQARFLF